MVKTLLNLKEFIELYPPKKALLSTDLKVGDTVACYDQDGQLAKVGTVKHISEAGDCSLPRGHVDGKVGEVFVLDSSRARTNTRKSLKGFCVVFSFFVLFF